MKNKIIPFLFGAVCVFAIAAGVSVQRFYATGPTLVQTGTSVTVADGTVTNSFTITYSSAPKVIISDYGTALQSATNIVTVATTSNFVYKSQIPNSTNNWIAVGTP